MIKCPRCNISQGEANKCQYCGLSFDQIENQSPKVSSNRYFIILLISILVLGAIVFIHKPGSAADEENRMQDALNNAKGLLDNNGMTGNTEDEENKMQDVLNKAKDLLDHNETKGNPADKENKIQDALNKAKGLLDHNETKGNPSDKENKMQDALNNTKGLLDQKGMIGSFIPDSSSKEGGITFWDIMISLITSLIGMGYFGYGKRKDRFVMIICGVLLMVYTYFVHQIIMVIVIGVILCALPFLV